MIFDLETDASVDHNEARDRDMENYTNLGGNSNVSGYEIGDDWIRVQFGDGSIYRYTYASTGRDDIETMKNLAHSGQGLNSFIGRIVKKRYASREV